MFLLPVAEEEVEEAFLEGQGIQGVSCSEGELKG
jgi:hypothetical protein